MNTENFLKKHFNKILLLLVLIIAGAMYCLASPNQIIWVAGAYGKICYPKGQEHGNIRYPIEYPTLDKCEKSRNRKDNINPVWDNDSLLIPENISIPAKIFDCGEYNENCIINL